MKSIAHKIISGEGLSNVGKNRTVDVVCKREYSFIIAGRRKNCNEVLSVYELICKTTFY